MDAELRAAIEEYEAQLASVAELLAADPENEEAREVQRQLEDALKYTQQTLSQLGAEAGANEPGDAATSLEHGGCGEHGSGPGAATSAEGSTPGVASAMEAPAGARPRGGAPNNARMHPSNRYYAAEPDFAALAQQYEYLRPYVQVDTGGRAHLDTTSWEATRALTAALLHHDFGISWWLPTGQLVPPVTNRANYLHWINDLLHLSSPVGEAVRGLDVGCGANFIYCLLGAALYGWTMVGVDVTQVAVTSCGELMEANPQLAALLQVLDLSHLHPDLQGAEAAQPAGGGAQRGRKRSRAVSAAAAAPADGGAGIGGGGGGGEAAAEGPRAAGAVNVLHAAQDGGSAQPGDGAAEGGSMTGILLPAIADDEAFAFTMCNPPFFESMQEAAQNPNTAFGGTAAEMVCPGGELAFVLQMLVESEALQDRVHWFSTMVGKKGTLKALRKEVHARGVTALRTTELAQGKTSRWAVAWSWQVDPAKALQPLRRAAEAPPQPAAVAAEAEQEGEPQAADALARAPMPVVSARHHISFTAHQSAALDARNVLQRLQSELQAAGCSSVHVDSATWTLTWPLGVPAATALSLSSDESGRSPTTASTDIVARLRVAQHQRRKFEVVATIPKSAPTPAAFAFTSLMQAVELSIAGG